MHIPRQPDAREVDRVPCRTVVASPTPVAASALRVRRDHLVAELRTVTYWQRLVQARTDLAVAGLLYTAPVPAFATRAAVTAPGVAGPWHRLDAPAPAGMDLAALLYQVGPLDGGPEGTGRHLEQLRSTSLQLLARHHDLSEQLDAVNAALHEELLQAAAVG